MEIILGIDIGGSTTKIVAFKETRKIIDSLQVKATDQITSLYGAIGHLLYKNKLSLSQVSKVVLTGIGANWIKGNIYGIPTSKIEEFKAIGFGGLMLSGLDEALITSMGTGTAFVMATKDKMIHIGGTGVGGGTLLGLSSKLLNEDNIDAIISLAQNGDLSNVDLSISDISNAEISFLPPDTTASNFGKISNVATKSDIALGLMNTIFQTVGMLAVFACSNTDIKDIVVTGAMTNLPQAEKLLSRVGKLYNIEFIIPPNATFATAIGAVELHFNEAESTK